MHPYAIVLAGIFLIVWILGTYGVFVNRNHLFFKCRDPLLLLFQLVGILITTTLQLSYIALKPHYSCIAFMFGAQCAFSLVAFPMAARTWHYCVQYHLALLRSKYRASTELKKGWENDHWFFRNKWVGSSKFLRKLTFSTCWVCLLAAVPEVFQPDQYAYKTYGACKTYPGAVFASAAISCCFSSFTILAIYLIWKARDAFGIKTEMKVTVIIWAIVFSVWVPWSSINFSFQLTITSSLWMVIGFFLTVCLCAFYPLFLIYRQPEPQLPKQDDRYKTYLEELEYLPFRNAFFAFMETQFCQENLLFYEAVMDWKHAPTNKRCSVALTIRETFIDESGLCQVNIDAISRSSIEDLVKANTTELPDNTFDIALEEVLSHMHVNSYVVFKQKAPMLVQQSA